MSKKLFILIVVGLLGCAGCSVNSVTGKRQLSLFMPSPAKELKIGQKYAPEMEKQMGGRLQNEQVQNYVNQVGQKIAKASHTPDAKFQYQALNDDTVNAFALPGGYVYITKGMLKQLDSEAQLAAILGHESAHVTARHSAQAMSEQIGMELLLEAVSISGQAPQGVTTAAKAGAQLVDLKYSRTHENEADSIGLDYMVKAGYNPIGMVETMQILQKQSGGKSFDWLSTHPNPKNRLGTIQDKIHSKYRNAGNLATNETAYRQNVLQNL
jgi:beta-barrel assembly-enhancing protease